MGRASFCSRCWTHGGAQVPHVQVEKHSTRQKPAKKLRTPARGNFENHQKPINTFPQVCRCNILLLVLAWILRGWYVHLHSSRIFVPSPLAMEFVFPLVWCSLTTLSSRVITNSLRTTVSLRLLLRWSLARGRGWIHSSQQDVRTSLRIPDGNGWRDSAQDEHDGCTLLLPSTCEDLRSRHVYGFGARPATASSRSNTTALRASRSL